MLEEECRPKSSHQNRWTLIEITSEDLPTDTLASWGTQKKTIPMLLFLLLLQRWTLTQSPWLLWKWEGTFCFQDTKTGTRGLQEHSQGSRLPSSGSRKTLQAHIGMGKAKERFTLSSHRHLSSFSKEHYMSPHLCRGPRTTIGRWVRALRTPRVAEDDWLLQNQGDFCELAVNSLPIL